jgi:hypothetical protein
MNALRVLEVGRVAAVVATVAALPAGVQVFRPWQPFVLESGPHATTDVVPGAGRGDSLDEKVIARDPFRSTRHSAAVPFDPNPPAPMAAEPPPPKPTLAVTGIVWGAAPSAVLEGLPGVEGARLVRAGEVIAGFRVRRITAHEVTVTGMDTTWVLKVRKPW